jgi:hypothetical protein
MKRSDVIIRKYANYFLTNNREVMEPEDIKELTEALGVSDDVMVAECKRLKQSIDEQYGAADTDEKLEEYYNKEFIIGFDNDLILLPSCADVYSAVLEALDYIIATHQ